MRPFLPLLCCLFAVSLSAQRLPTQPVGPLDFERPPAFDASPITMGHYTPARQASSAARGPVDNNCTVQISDLERDLGKDVGASPWHVVSAPRYGSDAVTLWGVTLTDVYRYLVDGDRFTALDHHPINRFPSSITWNMVSTDDGRVVVPDPNGFRANFRGLRSNDPSLLVFQDDPDNRGRTDGSIQLTHLFALSPAELRPLLRDLPPAARMERSLSGTSLVPAFSGEFVTHVTYKDGEDRHAYLVVVDERLERIVAAGKIGVGLMSNAIPSEPTRGGGTAFYIPFDETLVKMVYTPGSSAVEHHWTADLPVRDRTGSTPTLMNTSDGGRYVVLIDSKCTVAGLLNGLITCNEDQRPSQLVSVDRTTPAGRRPRVTTTALPDWLRTVENSPSAYGDRLVVANYTGYLPNGLIVPPGGEVPNGGSPGAWLVSPDAEEEFATGIVGLVYDAETRRFVIDWADAGRQVSSITAISAGSNRVYGTGAEEGDQTFYLYGFRLADDAGGAAGELMTRIPLGAAPFRRSRRDRDGNLVFARRDYQIREGEIFDPGNQILILNDGSLILSGVRSLVRVRQRP